MARRRTTADWIRGFAAQGMSQEEIIGLLGTTPFQISNALNRQTREWNKPLDLPGCEKCGSKPYAQVPSMAGGPRRCGACGAHYRCWVSEPGSGLRGLRDRYAKRCEECGSMPSMQEPRKIGKAVQRSGKRCKTCGATSVHWKRECAAAVREELRQIVDRGRQNVVAQAPAEPAVVAYTSAELEARRRAVADRLEEITAALPLDLIVPPPSSKPLPSESSSAASRAGRPKKSCGTVPRLNVVRDRAEPTTRADCLGGERPCPWQSCRYHLATAMPSCALDVVDANPDGVTLDIVGKLMDVSRERIRQIENLALQKLRLTLGPDGLARLLTERSDRAVLG